MFRRRQIIKIYDEDYNNIGRATRQEVHEKGLLHQVAHLWMFQLPKDTRRPFIYFQKRAAHMELFPGKYDLIQATHCDPEESYEEAIVRSMDLYLGSKLSKQDIIHIGSLRQYITQGSYNDNTLVQVFAINVSKALFIMPDTEEIVKVYYNDYLNMVKGSTDTVTMYSLDDEVLGESHKEEWVIRTEEVTEVLQPYIDAKMNK